MNLSFKRIQVRNYKIKEEKKKKRRRRRRRGGKQERKVQGVLCDWVPQQQTPCK